ncbi:hypothetical protein [Methanofollis fontis]|uniref:DUF4276 family protein n=1 Tax=Methanofollis fontis TaxID=2052832 RepID=A0A483CVE0_9EURY|nr:hypothetical protein [Methanofollis fontis]TAJ45616.1 hypothetical protein CUJ86_02525 [Methanofollis fontis]
MPDKPLYVLLEGPDDERFFSHLIAPLCARRGYSLRVWKYACEKRQRTINLVRAIRRSQTAYIFVRDIDRTRYARRRVQETLNRFGHAMEAERIVIVITEIESWYIAGLGDADAARLGIREHIGRTDRITKEDFNALIPRGVSRIEFLHEILVVFDIERARRKNRSFRYFMDWFVEGERLE